MSEILDKVIQKVQESEISFSKYITANDVGLTGGHQSGFHIHKNAWSLFFDDPGVKGNNKDKFITIKWQDNFETESRFIYYGVGTRNEYRLTRFGKGFPFLQDNNIGDLLVICKIEDSYYNAFLLQSDDDIDDFFAALNISSLETNRIIPRQFQLTAEERLQQCFLEFINTFQTNFPSTTELSARARYCHNYVYNITQGIIRTHPDREILAWLDAEFQLFKAFENNIYAQWIRTPFNTVEEFIEVANTILNRRKSRAGKSLEHHLSEIFTTFGVQYSTQGITEGNKKPDFIFPNIDAYHNPNFNSEKLVVLASKTTCKDRWRQILNEADRVETKHLFTLQQGISGNQLEEMYKYNVRLVVPRPYLTSFPAEYRERILALDTFMNYIQETQT